MALSNRDASIILGMVARGDKRHDIAAWFGENQARIAEVEQGAFGNLQAAPANDLPPRGAPGPKGRRLRSKVARAIEAFDGGNAAEARRLMQEGIDDFNRNEI